VRSLVSSSEAGAAYAAAAATAPGTAAQPGVEGEGPASAPDGGELGGALGALPAVLGPPRREDALALRAWLSDTLGQVRGVPVPVYVYVRTRVVSR
jgi:hypothetical protein